MRTPLRLGWERGIQDEETTPLKYFFGEQDGQPELGPGAASDTDRCVVLGCGRKALTDLAIAWDLSCKGFSVYTVHD